MLLLHVVFLLLLAFSRLLIFQLLLVILFLFLNASILPFSVFLLLLGEQAQHFQLVASAFALLPGVYALILVLQALVSLLAPILSRDASAPHLAIFILLGSCPRHPNLGQLQHHLADVLHLRHLLDPRQSLPVLDLVAAGLEEEAEAEQLLRALELRMVSRPDPIKAILKYRQLRPFKCRSSSVPFQQYFCCDDLCVC